MRAVRGEIRLKNDAAGDVAGTCVIRLLGDFDMADRHRLIDVFCTAQGASDVVVDLSGCSYADFSLSTRPAKREALDSRWCVRAMP